MGYAVFPLGRNRGRILVDADRFAALHEQGAMDGTGPTILFVTGGPVLGWLLAEDPLTVVNRLAAAKATTGIVS